MATVCKLSAVEQKYPFRAISIVSVRIRTVFLVWKITPHSRKLGRQLLQSVAIMPKYIVASSPFRVVEQMTQDMCRNRRISALRCCPTARIAYESDRMEPNRDVAPSLLLRIEPTTRFIRMKLAQSFVSWVTRQTFWRLSRPEQAKRGRKMVSVAMVESNSKHDLVNQARKRLEQNAHFRGRSRLIRIDEQNGTLVLRGRLPSFYLKQILQTVLLDMDGVSHIDNRVEVLR